MQLLLDMGNSRLKSAVLSRDKTLTQHVAVAYEPQEPIQTLVAHLDQYQTVKSIVIVSVLGGEFRQQLTAICKQRNIELQWAISEAHAKGIVNQYHKPEQLGADRFVALVGARNLFPDQSCIVIDCGTAVTIDALTDNGVFCGGVIVPGLALWGERLIGRADQLNDHQVVDTQLLAKNTAQAIGSGSVFGLSCAIEGIYQRMSVELQKVSKQAVGPKAVICGGDAALVTQYTQLDFELMPHLVLMGLAAYT
ncbi:MAG: type III pantothenate kinase [Leucothrix sp.]